MPAAPLSHPLLTGSEDGPGPRSVTPPGGGGKFAPDGEVLPFPGNTILCHIDPASAAHRALAALQDRARAAPWGRFFAFLPPASFHMTLFEGVCMNPGYRSEWPAGAAPDLTRNEVSRLLLDRLAGVRLPAGHRIRPCGIRHKAGIGVLVAGATEQDDASLRRCREILRDATGLVAADFADYRFHITLAYLLRWMDPVTAEAARREVLEFFDDFAHAAPEIALGPPEFCNFETMHAFTPLRLLHEAP